MQDPRTGSPAFAALIQREVASGGMAHDAVPAIWRGLAWATSLGVLFWLLLILVVRALVDIPGP